MWSSQGQDQQAGHRSWSRLRGVGHPFVGRRPRLDLRSGWSRSARRTSAGLALVVGCALAPRCLGARFACPDSFAGVGFFRWNWTLVPPFCSTPSPTPSRTSATRRSTRRRRFRIAVICFGWIPGDRNSSSSPSVRGMSTDPPALAPAPLDSRSPMISVRLLFGNISHRAEILADTCRGRRIENCRGVSRVLSARDHNFPQIFGFHVLLLMCQHPYECHYDTYTGVTLPCQEHFSSARKHPRPLAPRMYFQPPVQPNPGNGSHSCALASLCALILLACASS